MKIVETFVMLTLFLTANLLTQFAISQQDEIRLVFSKKTPGEINK